MAEARKYSTHPERLANQRIGTDWIVTSQGRKDRRVMVDPGDPKEVTPYYNEIEKELHTQFPTFNSIMAYFGYPGLTGRDLETLLPIVLMDPKSLAAAVPNALFQVSIQAVPLRADDVLAAQFFAPKITDVAVPPNTSVLGWRKAVRLNARAGSEAKSEGLVTAWLLFNVFSNLPDPFTSKSKNNQVMLIRGAADAKKMPVYWLVFGEVSDETGDGPRIGFLNASFDNRHGGDQKYYLPRACAQCHGGFDRNNQPDYANAKLNYFDTDHWFDRTKDDFNLKPGQGVLFDGGTVVDTDRFRRAFAVFNKLNAEVKAQNKLVDDGEQTFQFRAVSTWLTVHENEIDFVDMFDRNVAPAGGRQWTKDNPVDRQLLPLLSRYCYRCHSSVEYNVFDKDAVYEKAALMLDRLEFPVDDKLAMPQDRDLRLPVTRADWECLMLLLPQVGKDSTATCTP